MATKPYNLQLTESNVMRFNQLHPGRNLSYHVDQLLTKYNGLFEKTPEEYAEIAAQELKEELE